MGSNSTPNVDHQRWVAQMRRTLEQEELEEDAEIPVSIFTVPKNLLANNPDYYVPQLVALGPYHHGRPELYEMERYKLSAAKMTQKKLKTIKFQDLADQFTLLESKIQASYHKYLDFNGETLGWMMAVDSCFLLEFLRIYAVREGKVLAAVSSRMSHLVDSSGSKSAYNAIVRDLVMLENQIPFFLLRKILELQLLSLELADGMLLSMMIGLCKEISPFKATDPNVELTNCAHLLDFLYHMIVPKSKEQSEITEADEESEVLEVEGGSLGNPGIFTLFFSRLNGLCKYASFSRGIKVMLWLPWAIISSLPGLRLLKQPIAYLLFSENRETKPGNKDPESNHISRPPLVEEITIPSVTELSKAGVCFLPTNGSIFTVHFDFIAATLYLPTISLEANTEVILRNLVAYEACNASGPLVFTRYTELMNGIIDVEEDAKLLREKGIMLNHLKSDEEAANLWNGMTRSVRLTKVPFIDEVIEDVNRYYNGIWKIKLMNFMESHMSASRQFLTFLVAILLLLLLSLQAYCSLFGCAHRSRVRSTQ
ncbi:hypothetical protein NMG60_11022360 [Bertholletia excelsa]